MAATLDFKRHNGAVIISVKGIFNAHLVNDFHYAYSELEPSDREILVDLENTEYLDSAALGMLIHMQKKLSNSQIRSIRLTNANERVSKLFQIMQFDKMFAIG